MSVPAQGVVYTFDARTQAWVAPGRDSLLAGAAGWIAAARVEVGGVPGAAAAYGGADSGQVIFVSPSGSDSAAGTTSAPKQTLAGALSAASNGAVIVMREGLYHESLSVAKAVTAQAY